MNCIYCNIFCIINIFQLLRAARASSQQLLQHTDVVIVTVNLLGSENLDISQEASKILSILGKYCITCCNLYTFDTELCDSMESGTLLGLQCLFEEGLCREPHDIIN